MSAGQTKSVKELLAEREETIAGLRAELAKAHEEIKRLRTSRDRLEREHGKKSGDVF